MYYSDTLECVCKEYDFVVPDWVIQKLCKKQIQVIEYILLYIFLEYH